MLNESIKRDFKLKDILNIPVDGDAVPFRVEHITDEKVYLVAVDCIGNSSMTDINSYLDEFMSKIPEKILDICCEIEHKINGIIVRKSKVTLLSSANTRVNRDCDGADDILFDGLRTEAERCKNDRSGKTCWYWEDTTYMHEDSVNGCYVSPAGVSSMNAKHDKRSELSKTSNILGVCPCICIKRVKINMMRAVVLKTDYGIKLLGCLQCSNGAWFNADGCFKYCNQYTSDSRNSLQAEKLSCYAVLLAKSPKESMGWFKHRENFIDIEIPYEGDQSYE